MTEQTPEQVCEECGRPTTGMTAFDCDTCLKKIQGRTTKTDAPRRPHVERTDF